jgi:hypothetical protein
MPQRNEQIMIHNADSQTSNHSQIIKNRYMPASLPFPPEPSTVSPPQALCHGYASVTRDSASGHEKEEEEEEEEEEMQKMEKKNNKNENKK